MCGAIVQGLRDTACGSKKNDAWLQCARQLGVRAASVAGKGPAVPPGSSAPLLVKAVVRSVLCLEPSAASSAIGMLNAFVDAIPLHLLFAAPCRVDVADREGGPFTALQLCFEVALLNIEHVETKDKSTCRRFLSLFNNLSRCSITSPKPLFYLSNPVNEIRRLASLCGLEKVANTTWCRVVEAFRAAPDIYEGTEERPDFTTVVETLVLPLQVAATSPHILRSSKFLTEWSALMESFCQRAALLPAGKANYHIEVLANAMAQINVDADTMESSDFSIVCRCVGITLRSIRTSSRSEHGYGSPNRTYIAAPLTLVRGIMRAAQGRLAANSWDARATTQYEGVVSDLANLLSNIHSKQAAQDVTSTIVPPTLEFLQHGFQPLSRIRTPTTPLQDAFVALWTSLVPLLATTFRDKFGDTTVAGLGPVFIVTLQHKLRTVVDSAVELWNTTLGDQPWLELPADLAEIASRIRRSRSDLILPGAPKVDKVDPSREANVKAATTTIRVSKSESSARIRAPSKKRTFLGRTGKFLVQVDEKALHSSSSPKRKAQSLDDDSKDFVDIMPPSPAKKRLLTEHQRETRDEQRIRRQERPATYTTLDETQSVAIDDFANGSPTPTPSPPGKGKGRSFSKSPTVSPERPGAQRTPPSEQAITPPSILKIRGRARASDLTSERTKKRRVSFDLEQNTIHEKVPIPSTPQQGRGTANRQPSSAGSGVVGSPPPTGLSPVRSNAARMKTRGEQMVGGVIVESSPSSPVLKVDDNAATHPSYVESPMSDNSFKNGVQRCLEPSMTPPQLATTENSCVCAQLVTCSRPVQEVLPYFHVTKSARRSIGIMLRGQKLATVGDFCSLSDEDFAKLPVKMTEQTAASLQKYAQKIARAELKERNEHKASPLAQFVGRNPTVDCSASSASETPSKADGQGPSPTATSPVVQALLACSNSLDSSKEELRKLSKKDQEVLRHHLGELLRTVSDSN